MKDYKGIRNTEKPIKSRLNTSIDKEAPHFLDSQYGLTFLNWGGENNVTSLKPYCSPATTNIPFSSKTSYQNDFCENSLNRSTSAKIAPLKRQHSNFFKYLFLNLEAQIKFKLHIWQPAVYHTPQNARKDSKIANLKSTF